MGRRMLQIGHLDVKINPPLLSDDSLLAVQSFDQIRTSMIVVVTVPVITKKPMLEKVVDQADT